MTMEDSVRKRPDNTYWLGLATLVIAVALVSISEYRTANKAPHDAGQSVLVYRSDRDGGTIPSEPEHRSIQFGQTLLTVTYTETTHSFLVTHMTRSPDIKERIEYSGDLGRTWHEVMDNIPMIAGLDNKEFTQVNIRATRTAGYDSVCHLAAPGSTGVGSGFFIYCPSMIR